MTDYTFSLASDFPQGFAGNEFLQQEIETSLGITPIGITTNGDDCIVHMPVPLDAGQVTQLDAVVTAHNSTALTLLRKRITYYARPGGNDANGGTNDTDDAVASWSRLIKLVDRHPPRGTTQKLDGTGVDWTEANELVLPEVFGGSDFRLDYETSGLDFTYYNYPLVFYAKPSPVLQVTIISVTSAPRGATRTITVEEILVPGAHVGQQILGDGQFEAGSIISNDVNTLVVASAFTVFTAPVTIVEPSSTWTFGDAGDPDTAGCRYVSHCVTAFTGIRFDATAHVNNRATFIPINYIKLDLCSFVNGFQVEGGGRGVEVDFCHFTGYYSQNGSPIYNRSSTFVGVTSGCHGEGGNGLSGFLNCEFDGCGPIGAGNFQSKYSFGMDSCRLNNSIGVAVEKADNGRCKFTNIYFENITSHCIQTSLPGLMSVVNCESDLATCGGWGINLTNGAQAQIVGSTNLEGALGQVNLGGRGATLYSEKPITDIAAASPQFCRIF